MNEACQQQQQQKIKHTHTHKVDTVPTAYNSIFKTFKTESFDMRSVTICRKIPSQKRNR